MSRRFTHPSEDAAFLLRRFIEAQREWKVGDECMTYRMDGITKVAAIRGDLVELENGDVMHRTKMREVQK